MNTPIDYITISGDGVLTQTQCTDIQTVFCPLGEDVASDVPLTSTLGAWVGDRSLLDGAPRNILGSLTLIALGAPRIPYAGPIVIAGLHWDEATGLMICALSPLQLSMVRLAHQMVSLPQEAHPSPVARELTTLHHMITTTEVG